MNIEQIFKKLSDDDGVVISLKTPGREKAGLDDFCGMCHGAGGCTANSPTKSDLHQAADWFDMDAAMGIRRHPGTAGAHPVMQRARTADEYGFMAKQAGSLVPKLVEPKAWSAAQVGETD